MGQSKKICGVDWGGVVLLQLTGLRGLLGVTVCFLSLSPLLGYAHHSVSYHFDPDAPNVINGVVQAFRFKNPHTEMWVDVTEADGSITRWRVEMTSRSTLQKQGWTDDQFRVGEQIRVSGFLARREANTMYLREAEVSSGPSTTFEYGKLAPSPVVSAGATASINRSVLGRWVRATPPENPHASGQPLGPDDVHPFVANLTPAGLAAGRDYVAEVDDPALRCEAASILRVWGQPDFSPTEIRQEGDRILVHHEVFDFHRTIFLNAEHPNQIEPSKTGHSIGYFEGDTLVIDTQGFLPGILITHPGVYHSHQMHVVERIWVDPQTGGMTYHWKGEDPQYFENPLEQYFYFARTDTPMGQFNCQLD